MSRPSPKHADGYVGWSTSTASRSLSPRPNHEHELADHRSSVGETVLEDFFDLYSVPTASTRE